MHCFEAIQKRPWVMMVINVCLLFILSLFFSCGKAFEDKSTDLAQEEVVADGIYSAILLPVNPRLNAEVHGDVRITKYTDQLEVSVHVKNAPITRIKQAVHTGAQCPKDEQDINRDGYIYAIESYPVTGFIVLPLDNDLGSQSNGSQLTFSGNYHYKRSTSYYLMLSDLHLPDQVINDSIVKLNHEDLIFDNKVVTLYSETNNGEIPIACGVLQKISDYSFPDEEWDEEPYPIPHQRPRPRPTPVPEPDLEPEIEPSSETTPDSWWERLRNRWRLWRDRRHNRDNLT